VVLINSALASIFWFSTSLSLKFFHRDERSLLACKGSFCGVVPRELGRKFIGLVGRTCVHQRMRGIMSKRLKVV
jgi:hypothetical protein